MSATHLHHFRVLTFSCNLCDLTSNTESYFNIHMKENHEEILDKTVETILEKDNEKQSRDTI